MALPYRRSSSRVMLCSPSLCPRNRWRGSGCSRPSTARAASRRASHGSTGPRSSPSGASPALGPTDLVIPSISPLVARTITVGVTTETSAEAAMNTVNGGHGATKVRYEKAASAHAPRRVSLHCFISSLPAPSEMTDETTILPGLAGYAAGPQGGGAVPGSFASSMSMGPLR